jgi:3-oxoacyl-[acyl-carrier protein] reductase
LTVQTGLDGKVALVTAASKGLGRASAEALAREGARVAICARDEARLCQTAGAITAATGAEVLPVVADVAVAADIARLVETTVARFGGLDVLVTNAGGPKSGPFESLDDGDWAQAVDLLLMSVVRLSRAALPHLRRRGGGRIINITSVSVKQPIASLVLSNALRAAVVGLSKTLASEVAGDGVLVNCVAPGYTRTDRVTALQEAAARREGVEPAEIERRTIQRIPLGRMGEPGELGDVVAFLASDRAAYLTGATIQVDGGYVTSLL